eukprot:5968763-Pleurochrysis_carterae.AAC.5
MYVCVYICVESGDVLPAGPPSRAGLKLTGLISLEYGYPHLAPRGGSDHHRETGCTPMREHGKKVDKFVYDKMPAISPATKPEMRYGIPCKVIRHSQISLEWPVIAHDAGLAISTCPESVPAQAVTSRGRARYPAKYFI